MVHNREGFEKSGITEKRLLKLCRTIGAHQPDMLSNQLLMLIEGAYSTAGILGKRDAVKATAKAAEALIDTIADR
jgi:hypothetical protein